MEGTPTARRLRRTQPNPRPRPAGVKPKSPHVLYLNVPAFNDWMSAEGRRSLTDKARHLALPTPTLSRALEGEPIGGPFVSAMVKALGEGRHLENYVLGGDLAATAKAA